MEYGKHTNDLEAGCDNSHLFNKVHYRTNSSKPISSEYWIQKYVNTRYVLCITYKYELNDT